MSKRSEAVIRWRKRKKEKMISAMGGKCQCCGYNNCNEAMEFHHIDPSKKEYSFGMLRSNPKALVHTITELRKCILVCSNCHKEIHNGARELPESFSSLNEELLLSENDIKRIERMKLKENKPPRGKILFSNEQLKEMLAAEFENNISALARSLSVSDTAIRKKLKKVIEKTKEE